MWKRGEFARYGAWLTKQGHALGEVIAADVAAEVESGLKHIAKDRARQVFKDYVENHLGPRFSRIAKNMVHFTKDAFPLGMSFRYGLLRKLDTFTWTRPMRDQVLSLLADDHAAWVTRLCLRNFKFEDFEFLSSLKATRTLNFRWADIASVRSLEPLANMSQLRALNVSDSAVSDLVTDLRPLLSCPSLCNVGLWDTPVPKSQLETLKESMKENGAQPVKNQEDLISGYERYISHNDFDWY